MTLVPPLVNQTQIFDLIGPFFRNDYRHFLEPPPRTREDAFIFRWGRTLSTVLCWIQIDFIWSSCWLLFIFMLLFRFLLYWSCQRSTEWFHVCWQILFVGLKGAATELTEEQINADAVTGGSGDIWSLFPRVSSKLVYWFPVARLIAWLTDWPASQLAWK